MSEPKTKLGWRDERTPVSQQFDDVYFDTTDGLAEARYVFLEGNSLAARWKSETRSEFVIGELGFGTGLNFLAALELWCSEPRQGRLCFESCELFPLALGDLERALKGWPELSALSELLLAQYNPMPGASQQIELKGGVTLILHYQEALKALEKFRPVDAWFLDGFSPSKNPEMWRNEVLDAVHQKSAPGASLATFSCAGAVRRGLSERGFQVSKKTGFGKKREMLVGRRET